MSEDFLKPATTPGLKEALVRTTSELVKHAKRYETQQGASTFPGPGTGVTKRVDLPEVVIDGCPHCGGDLSKEDVHWGYGDYACVACGRAWYVQRITKAGLVFVPVARVATEEPIKEAKRR